MQCFCYLLPYSYSHTHFILCFADQEKCDDDEMERLYKSLEQASLSPIGDRRLSTKKELRKSFIKRSKNPSINEKLHKIRMLNSTLKVRSQSEPRKSLRERKSLAEKKASLDISQILITCLFKAPESLVKFLKLFSTLFGIVICVLLLNLNRGNSSEGTLLAKIPARLENLIKKVPFS